MRNAASDYIPGAGFHFQPSDSWPPLKSTPLILQQASGPDFIVEDQIQQYVDNSLLDHPLVSPVNQGSLGGLPPLFIVRLFEHCGPTLIVQQAGGSGELLCDEIIYTAHKVRAPLLTGLH
jgi:acetyl esterase/lipase